jgi:hypothetical protein
MKTRFHLYAIADESLARRVAETAFALGVSQAHLIRWATTEFLATAEARVAALKSAGALPPPIIGAKSTPKSRPNRNPKRPEPGVDEPF